MEIAHQLHGKVSERLVDGCLDEKYKQKHRVENARKRKKTQVSAYLAAPLLLEQEKPQQQIAVTHDGKSVTVDDNNEAKTPAINQTKSVVEQTPCPKTDTSLVAPDKLTRNKSDCPNCNVLRLHNQELEEALHEATTLSTADTLNSPAYVIPNEESEIEFSLPYPEVQQYMAAEYKREGSKVWFNCMVDVKSKKVTSAKTGRISVDIN